MPQGKGRPGKAKREREKMRRGQAALDHAAARGGREGFERAVKQAGKDRELARKIEAAGDVERIK